MGVDLQRLALLSLTVTAAGCVGVADFYLPASRVRAPRAAIADCRAEAAGLHSPDINATARPTPATEQAGTLIGNSVGDALLFRRRYADCMTRRGYERRA